MNDLDWYEYTAEEMSEPVEEQIAHVMNPATQDNDEENDYEQM